MEWRKGKPDRSIEFLPPLLTALGHRRRQQLTIPSAATMASSARRAKHRLELQPACAVLPPSMTSCAPVM
jgi:hypothetical protein